MSDGPFDLRYASSAEYYQLKEDVAVLKNDIGNKLDTIIKQNEQRNSPDHAALGMHDVAKALRDLPGMLMQGPSGMRQQTQMPWRFVSLAVMACATAAALALTKGHMW